MNTMNMINMGQMDAYMAPLWLIHLLSAVFFAGFLFYLYRLMRPEMVKRVYGYYDWQNEVVHGLGLLAMSNALAPSALQLPGQFWAVTLSVSGAFFFVRAATWGRKLPYNKWWWDWAHVGMLWGMVPMFLAVDIGPAVYVLEAFWLWFAAYYVHSLVHDLEEPKFLYIGSDLSHLVKGAVMFIMTVAPMALMVPGGNMPGMMICSPGAHLSEPAPATQMPAMPGMSRPGMSR